MAEQLLSTRDAAIRLGISSERVRQLVKVGKLTAIRVSSGWVFAEAEVLKLADQRQFSA